MKVIDSQLVKKLGTLHGTGKFVTQFTNAHHLLVPLPSHMKLREGADKSLDRPGTKKELQRPNSGFIQHTPHEAQYTS